MLVKEAREEVATIRSAEKARADERASKAWEAQAAAERVASEARVELERLQKTIRDAAAKERATVRTRDKARDKEAAAVAQAETEAEQRAVEAEVAAERRIAEAAAEAERSAAEAARRIAAAQADAQAAQRCAEHAQAEALEAHGKAAAARAEAIAVTAAIAEAESKVEEAARMNTLYALQTERAKRAAVKLKKRVDEMPIAPSDRSPEKWAGLKVDTKRQAAKRERDYLKYILNSHSWRAVDLAAALHECGLLAPLFGTKEHNLLYFDKVRKLMRELEVYDFGLDFGLYLHFEMNLTMEKILQLTQAASKRYAKERNFYASKVLQYDPHTKSNVVLAPRIAPPRSKLEPAILAIRERLGIQSSENGRVAYLPFDSVMQELLSLDPGTHDMPPLPFFLGGQVEMPLVVSHDATGHGQLQLTTIVVKNPWMSHAAEALYPFGLGNIDDGRNGTIRLLGPNREVINEMIRTRREHGLVSFTINGAVFQLAVRLLFVMDVSALRHCQLLANSGFCGCSREVALRKVPARPSTIEEMKALAVCGSCRSPTARELAILGHRRVDGKLLPCPAEGCKFAHDPSTADAEEAAMLAEESKHLADIAAGVKGAKERYSKWRMRHANMHRNVQPGTQGEAVFEHDLDDQILDALHLSELNLPKMPWKHGVLNNSSDDAREAISAQLKEWGYPLDTRRKDNNRVRAQKWFTGAAWAAFCKGYGKSPGGPIAIATLVLIMAKDLQERGVSSGSGVAPTTSAAAAAASGGRGQAGRGRGGGGRGRGSFAERIGGAAGPAEQPAHQPTHQPTALERAADPSDLAMIRELFGSRAQTIIDALLAFDGYFQFYYPFKESIPFLAPIQQRETHALLICQRGVDLQEIYERVAIYNHKSFLPHACWGKVPRDILKVADVWAVNLSALELHNAKAKRTASTGGARRIVFGAASTGQARKPLRAKEGPAQLVTTAQYSTTMALSTLSKLLAGRALRRGHGLEGMRVKAIESRTRERLLEVGRSTRLSTGIKLEKLGADYDPRDDTCVRAFVRLLAASAGEGEGGASGDA